MSQRLEEKSRLRAAKESGIAEGIAKGLAEGMTKGLVEGVAKGIPQGEESQAKKMALKMFRRGDSLEEISNFVEFPKDVVATWLPS